MEIRREKEQQQTEKQNNFSGIKYRPSKSHLSQEKPTEKEKKLNRGEKFVTRGEEIFDQRRS